ncbi:MAG TPA: hypothetical protein VGE74_12895 [Gemmata sp.]
MTFAELTDAQKADIASLDGKLRALFAALAKAASAANPLVLQAFAATRVTPVIASLAPGELIPNSTNFAGAAPLTAAEFNAMQTLSDQLNALYAGNLVLLSKMVGVNAG